MPTRFRLILTPKVIHPLGVPEGSGIGVRAAILEAVQRLDSATAGWLHDRPRLRPYCVTPVMGLDARDPAPYIELGVAVDELADGFRRVLDATREIQVGHSSFHVHDVLQTGAPFRELLAGAPIARTWTVRFLAPTTVRTAGPGPARSQPFPTPESIFGSLARRWDTFSPVSIPDEVVDAATSQLCVEEATVRVEKAKVVPERQSPPRRAQWEKGCVGSVTYTLSGGSRTPGNTLSGISALVLLGALCGVGDRTTVGMGVMEPVGLGLQTDRDGSSRATPGTRPARRRAASD